MERSHLLMTLLGLGQIGRRKAEFICEHRSLAIEAGLTAIAEKGLMPRTVTPTAIEQAVKTAAASISLCAKHGWQIINKFEQSFPTRLGQIADPPVVLYCQGDLAGLERFPSVAVIGSRAASPHAMQISYQLGAELARIGATVVSGLALGCDTAAHRGCLDYGGYTAAVLPSGFDLIYPPQNADLAAKIAKSGCLLSEYPPGVQPARYRFVERDRLQSGLSDIVIVVETGVKGGAMHTARFAKRQGRRLIVFNPDLFGGGDQSKGSQQLLSAGAEKADSVEAAIQLVQATQPGLILSGALF